MCIRDSPLTARPKRKNTTLTEYVLVALTMGTLGVMAVPQREPSGGPLEGAAVSYQAQDALTELRAAVIAYMQDHGVFPGYTPGRRLQQLLGGISMLDLRGQLRGWSDERGYSTYVWTPRYRYGPYLLYGMPTNPLNGLDTVMMIPDSVDFPSAPNGETGWIYKPENGEVRLNSSGFVPGHGGTRYFDL